MKHHAPSRRPLHGTKIESVHRRLRELAYQYGPEAKLPTVLELCESFETSRSTINDALEQLEAQDVIRRRRGSGIYVSPAIAQRNIALLFRADFFHDGNASPFWDLLWSKFLLSIQQRSETRAETYGVHLVRSRDGRTQDLDSSLVRMIQDGRLDGVLGIGLELDTVDQLKEAEIPVVGFAGLGGWNVILDADAFIQEGVRQLLALGCRRPRLCVAGFAHYVTNWREDPQGRSREGGQVRAFRDALRDAGLPCADDQIWDFSESREPPILIEQGRLAAELLIQRGLSDGTDGLVFSNDLMALGAMRVLQRAEIGRLQIVSFANRGTLTLYAFEDALTQVLVDPDRIVQSMFSLLDALLAGFPPKEDFIRLGPSAVARPALA